MKKQQVTIEVPEGYTAVFTRVGDFANVTFEPIEQPKEEPKLPMCWEEITESREFSKAETYWPTSEEYEAHFALYKLLWLRNAWGGQHYSDCEFPNDVFALRDYYGFNSNLFVFPTEELRDRFQTQFADLIKTASPLL